MCQKDNDMTMEELMAMYGGKKPDNNLIFVMKIKPDLMAAKLIKWGYKLWTPNEKMRRIYINDVPGENSKLYYDVLDEKWKFRCDDKYDEAIREKIKKFKTTPIEEVPSNLRDAESSDFPEDKEVEIINKYTGHRGILRRSMGGLFPVDFKSDYSYGNYYPDEDDDTEALEICYVDKNTKTLLRKIKEKDSDGSIEYEIRRTFLDLELKKNGTRYFKKGSNCVEIHSGPVAYGEAELIVKTDELKNIYDSKGNLLDYDGFIEVYAHALCKYLNRDPKRLIELAKED